MMARWSVWWNGRSHRERVMLVLMAVLVAGVLGWLALYRPLSNASRDLANALEIAAQRKASIAVKVEQLKAATAHPAPRSSGAINIIVEASAKQAGLNFDTVDVRGDDRVSITIASTRSSVLLAWLGALEAEGVVVETATIAPGNPAGTVRVQAVLYRLGARG
jgi:general secretion pathway protein M